MKKSLGPIVFISFIIVFFGFSFIPQKTFADTTCPTGVQCLPNPLGSSNTTIADVLKTILDWITTKIGPPLAVLMIVIGAFMMIFSAGDTDRFKTGRQTIVYTVIGYGIIFIAWGVVSLIQNILKP